MKRIPIAILSLLFALGPAQPALAFNPNLLLSDFELTDGSALSKAGIENFLQSKGGELARKRFTTPFGEQKAADIIYSAGKHYGISQKYLLVRLQTEQSLVTNPNPSDRAYNFATGYGCPDTAPCSSTTRGFYNQVHWAARVISEYYLPSIAATGCRGQFCIGRATTVQDWDQARSVTPENAATVALYNYTPHVYNGNFNITKFMSQWFTRVFPDGAFVREAGADNYYLIEFGKKRKFRSLSVAASHYDLRKAIPATGSELGAYEPGTEFVFPEYSLIRSPRGTVFLIIDGQKRGIPSREVFRSLGFHPEEVQEAAWADINLLPDGPVITLESAYPVGALLQSVSTGGITYVENGVRRAIYSRDIFVSNYKGQKTISVTQDEIEKYGTGDPVRFKDGEIVTSTDDRAVYFISNGERRPIANREVFDSLGLKWSNLITTDNRSLSLHPIGATLDTTTQE